MGNTVVAFRLYTPSGLLQFYSSFNPILTTPCTIMAAKKGTSSAVFISKYIEAQNNCPEEDKETETFEFDDFEPFMAMFCRYRPELSETEKESVMTRGLIKEVSDLEKDLCSVKEKIEPIFNFIDVSFQLLDGPYDHFESIALLIKN